MNKGEFRYFDVDYNGDYKEFVNLLKKKMSFDFKNMGNNTIYLKVPSSKYEDFQLYMQTTKKKGKTLKSYTEITEQTYNGALVSLDNILKSK